MKLRRYTIALAASAMLLSFAATRAQQINAPVTPQPSPLPGVTSPAPASAASPAVSPTPTPTPPPIVVQPPAAQVPVGARQTVRYGSTVGSVSAAAVPAGIVEVTVDQTQQTLTLQGRAPGAATITITDQRGVSATVPVRVAYVAGTVGEQASIRITGDPASSAFVKDEALRAALSLVQIRPGAQIAASTDQINFPHALSEDHIADVAVPILLQGEQYFSVDATTHVRVENIAAPKIMPERLMVSDYPEKLTENGVLFAADVKRTVPSRFLYFHYNPPGEPARRLVVRVQNLSAEPALLQYISGVGGPDPNEMAAGHACTSEFLRHLAQNEGRVTPIAGNATIQLATQDLPARDVACALLQLRVLNGSAVHLTLFAQNASSPPDEPISNETLLTGDHPHARGIYSIPEFHHSRQWSVNDQFLELQIGQIPLPNSMQGEALSGDYGVLESFVIKVQNPNPRPVPIAIYENPRGGRATGTFLIDGVMIQSHQVPPFSHYKLRQYVVPARGFLRVTIETIPDSGSSYPVNLEFAPDDGSVAPSAPGSPVY